MFDSAGLLNYADAEKFCKSQEDSRLLTVDFEDKQKFVEEFLESNSIVDNVWIGLQNVNGTYRWSDGSKFQYSNLRKDNLKSDESHCVQIQTESSKFGQWSEESCSKKNGVICEKIQKWSLDQLQTAVMNLRKEVVPINFIYVQLPREKAPTTIWPSTEWEDITLNYEGVFFRAGGGGAASFGEIQEADSPRLTRMAVGEHNSSVSYISMDVEANGEFSKVLSTRGNPDYFMGWGMQVIVSNAEVRPRNMAVKIWKRVA